MEERNSVSGGKRRELIIATLVTAMLGISIWVAVPTEAQENTAKSSAQAWRISDLTASQAEPSDRETRQADPNEPQGELAGEEVDAQDRNENGIVDLATIQAENCVIDPAGATITIEDSDGTTGLLADGANVEIEATDNEIRIVGTSPNEDIFFSTVGGGDDRFSGDATVLRSTGIDCAGGDDNTSGGDGETPSDGDDSAGQDQYDNGNEDDVIDDNIPDQDDNGNEDDVIDDTIPNKNLPNTGGMPLSGLLLIGFALVGAGFSILRFGIQREE